jgi:acetyl esterase/lipase
MADRLRPLRAILGGLVGVVVVFFAGVALLPFWPPRTMGTVRSVLAAAELAPILAIGAVVALIAVIALGRRRPWLQALGIVVLCLTIGLEVSPAWTLAGTLQRAHTDVANLAPPVPADSDRVRPFGLLTQAIRGFPPNGEVTARRVGYTAADASPLTLLLFRGTAVGPRPTVVVIYGGAWQAGAADQASDASRHLAHLGYTVVAIDYRHAPRHRHPAQIDDVRRSLTLIADSATAWGVDTSRIVLLGRSAGGHLAMLAGFTPGPVRVRGVVAFYAPFDLEEGYNDLPVPDPIDVRSVLTAYLGGTPTEIPAQYRDASPSTYVRAGLPPTLLMYAERDHLVKPEFGRAVASRLREVGVPVVHVELPGAEHGFDLVPRGFRGRAGIDVVVAFLARVLG